MATTTATDAMDEVFDTNEITEMIFMHLSMRELLTIVPRICKTWLAHTKNPTLQKLTFRLPEITTSAITISGPITKLDNITARDNTNLASYMPNAHIARGLLRGASPLHGFLNYVSTSPTLHFNPFFCPVPDQSYAEHRARCETFGAKCHYPDASSFPAIIRPSLLDLSPACLDMLMTQPPLYAAHVRVLKLWTYKNGNRVMGTLRLGMAVVRNARGVRVGETLGQAKRLADLLKSDEDAEMLQPGWIRERSQQQAIVTIMGEENAGVLLKPDAKRPW